MPSTRDLRTGIADPRSRLMRMFLILRSVIAAAEPMLYRREDYETVRALPTKKLSREKASSLLSTTGVGIEHPEEAMG